MPAALPRFMFISYTKLNPNTSRDKTQGTEKCRNFQEDVPIQANE